MFKYFSNVEKRTIVALLTKNETGEQFRGKAVCHSQDEFNQDRGEKIASYRAVIKMRDAEIKKLHKFKHNLITTIERIDKILSKLYRNRAEYELKLKKLV